MKRAVTGIVLCFLFSLSSAPSNGQAPGGTPVHWKVLPPLQPVHPGESFEVRLEATIDGNWHLYSATQPPGGPFPTRFSTPAGGPFEMSGAVRQSAPTKQFDQNFGIMTEFFSTNATFWIPLKTRLDTAEGDHDIQLQTIYQVCDDRVCLPPHKVPIPLKVAVASGARPRANPAEGIAAASPAAGAAAATGGQAAAQSPPAPVAGISKPAATPTSSGISGGLTGAAGEIEQARSSGFLPFLWLSMTMGALSLATPCVFPMIPITVSYFTKKAEQGRSSGVRMALVYSLGIVLTFTGLGLGLAALLGTAGVNQFAANPWVNLLITAIFLGFALNLFGLYQIGVPSSVLTKLSKASSGTGYLQTLLMGLTFTLTSFTCTVPFVGTVLVATSQGEWLWPALGMLGYSVAFAAPFFILALLPGFVTALPKSGGWLNSVKVTMGFVEVAAAMKFVSNVDLVWQWHIFSREVVLAVWVAIAVLTTVYLLGKFRLPHDSPVESLGVMRMISALLFLAIGFYLFTGLLGGSLGELDAFLPPRTAGATVLTGPGGSAGQELTWNTDLKTAMAQARELQKPVFIDFTGYTCTNCRWMETNIFPLPAVHAQLEKYVRVQLYTDGSGKQYADNQQFQKENFGTVALPLYAILSPEGNKIAVFPGMTRKPEEFLRFLASPFTDQ